MKPFGSKRDTVFLIAVTALSLFLGSSRTLSVFYAAALDDGYFIKGALSILQGKWLGDYNQVTLIKGPFYSLFLAANNIVGLPLLLSQDILLCASGLLLVYAISQFYQSRWVLLAGYAAFVLHPNNFAVVRVTREGVYSSLTTFVLAFALLLAAGVMGKTEQHKTLYACGFGLSFACFWLTREEGIWLFPCLSLLFSLALANQYNQTHDVRTLIRSSKPLLVGVLLAVTLVTGVASLNKRYYGVFLARSELLSGEMQAAYGALTRVKTARWDEHIPVPREARHALYAVSPTFDSLKPYLEDPLTVNAWSKAGCAFYPSTCGDIAGGWFVWALRDAVQQVGQTTSAPQALSFYKKLAVEVNELCDSKQIDCLPPRTGLNPPLRLAYLKALPEAFGKGLAISLGLKDFKVVLNQYPSMPTDPEALTTITLLTKTPPSPTRIVHCPYRHVAVSGWLNWVDGDVWVVKKGGFLVKQTSASPDLVTAFKDPRLTNNRFQLDVCCRICALTFTDPQGRAVAQAALDKESGINGSGTYGGYFLDSVKPIPPEPANANTVKLAVLEAVNTVVYQHLLFYMNIVALGVWTIRLFWVRTWTIPFGLATCLLVAIGTRILLMAFIDVSSFPTLGHYYLGVAQNLAPVVSLLVLSESSKVFKQRNVVKLRRAAELPT